ncbi:putative Protein kinase domain containing protein [Blattamonas nauphoetae]|uniref:non-specific serine/threonine protein kinase n=1 Tax=Blattamonas nauphoetae TaxID=2049346 RepID=A0ABQ9Y305_9EUKA|nr:putative Protein kinase domain containing protein [Blattamonas nauphoetae]
MERIIIRMHITHLDSREFRIPKLLSRLTENVVKPDRLIATGDCIGIIMEYCEMSLSEAAKDPANQTEAFIRKVGRQMFRTLDVLQPHGFLHRDIKSDNILLQKRPNGSFVLKFSDFGTSKVGSLVSEHSFAGTPLSMSPEQLTPGKEITSKSDVFSTGITLYLVLKRHYPFSRQDSDDPAVFHVPASMEELTELMRDVSPDLSGLSAECASFFGAVFQLLPEKRPSAADILKMKFFAEEKGGGETEGKGKDEDFVPLSPSLSPLTPSVSLLAQMDALLSHTQILLLELANPSALVCAVCVVVLFEKTAADRRERERRAEEKGGDGETDAGAGREWEEDEGWAGGGREGGMETRREEALRICVDVLHTLGGTREADGVREDSLEWVWERMEDMNYTLPTLLSVVSAAVLKFLESTHNFARNQQDLVEQYTHLVELTTALLTLSRLLQPPSPSEAGHQTETPTLVGVTPTAARVFLEQLYSSFVTSLFTFSE